MIAICRRLSVMWKRLRFVLHYSREQTHESLAKSTVKYTLAQNIGGFQRFLKEEQAISGGSESVLDAGWVSAEERGLAIAFWVPRGDTATEIFDSISGCWFWLHQNYKNMRIGWLYLWVFWFLERGAGASTFLRVLQVMPPGLRSAARFDLDSAFQNVSFPVEKNSSFVLNFAYSVPHLSLLAASCTPLLP